MCGIVGIFSKSEATTARVGEFAGQMLGELSGRGPDSAGIAMYRDAVDDGHSKVSLYGNGASPDWDDLGARLSGAFGGSVVPRVRHSHATFDVAESADHVRAWLAEHTPELRVMSAGRAIEIYKQAGPPQDFIRDFGLAELEATHAVGHTRMATESRITTEHSHPFSTGLDLCLVHNGSLSNHNRLRSRLRAEGVEFQTDNDSEVAAGYLMWRIREGADLEEALAGCLRDLDGFYTFAVGTAEGFAVLRDPIACKPAVLAETDDWVAMASEYRAIAGLPNAAAARVWEPEPGRVYTWTRES